MGIVLKIYINASTIIVTNTAQLNKYNELPTCYTFLQQCSFKKVCLYKLESNLWFITTSRYLINMKMLEKKSLKEYLQIKRSFPFKTI